MKSFCRIAALIVTAVIAASVLCILPSAASEMTFKPTIDSDYMFGIPEKTTFDSLAAVMPGTILEVKDSQGNRVISGSNTYIGTGSVVSINGSSFTVVVLGDVNGDGVITSVDYLRVKRYYLGTIEIKKDAELLAAGDEDLDGKVKAYKYLLVKRHVLGSYNMNMDYTVPLAPPIDDESGWSPGWI